MFNFIHSYVDLLKNQKCKDNLLQTNYLHVTKYIHVTKYLHVVNWLVWQLILTAGFSMLRFFETWHSFTTREKTWNDM